MEREFLVRLPSTQSVQPQTTPRRLPKGTASFSAILRSGSRLRTEIVPALVSIRLFEADTLGL